MKTANFNYTDKENGHKGTGTVTLKDDGKISITNVYFYGKSNYGSKFRLKEFAKQIVELDFPSDLCFDFKTTENSIGLIKALFENTEDLKIEFLEQTKEWATNTFNRAKAFKEKSTEEHYKNYGITYTIKHGSMFTDHNSLNNSKYYEFKKEWDRSLSITYLGLEKYLEKRLKEAEEHYKKSIIKLASRLNNKGITEESNFTVRNSRIKQNFECTIISGNTKVRAWTIIASGEIQQPHYRYLIK